jgi:cytochrome c-type biogenesis protein CcmH/NrfF
MLTPLDAQTQSWLAPLTVIVVSALFLQRGLRRRSKSNHGCGGACDCPVKPKVHPPKQP